MDQQVLAAWVSAGAAVVQAIAAALAIWYSGKLARDSAARETAADLANARRIEEANAAAAEQRRLDREAAEMRARQADIDEYNRPIEQVLRACELILDDWEGRATREAERRASHAGLVSGSLGHEVLEEMREASKRVQLASTDRALVAALTGLRDFKGDKLSVRGEGGAQYVAHFQAKVAAFRAQVDELRSLLRTLG